MQQSIIPSKPEALVTEDDAWNYVIWYDFILGKHDDEKEKFWNWWTKFRKAKIQVEKEKLQDELGPVKLREWMEKVRQKFREAQEYRDQERKKK